MRKKRARLRTPLRDIRRARTLNQQQMAGLLEVTQQTYSKYESGVLTPPPHLKARCAAILGSAEDVLWPSSMEAAGA